MPDIINNQSQGNSVSSPDRTSIESRSHGEIKSSFSIDAYADGLMDELFEDVEGVLERGLTLPAEPLRPQLRPELRPEPLTIPFVNSPPLALTNAIAHRQAQWQGDQATDSLMQQVPGQLTEVKAAPTARPFDRLLVAATCASAVTAVGVWGITHGWHQRLIAVFSAPAQTTVVAPAPVASATVPSSQQFSEYMQRSLENINRNLANAPAGTASRLTPNMPNVAVSAAPTPLTTLPRPALAPLPAAPVQVSINDPTRNELVSILGRLNDVLSRLNLGINQPAPPAAVPPSTIKVLPLQAAATPAAVAVPPALQRTLSGVYQSANPDQSAALFEMNGVTQRYYPGESIGTSGWILVEVKNNQVVVRRNGDVRTIEAGQKLE
jgi:Type II secretion system protein C